MTIAQVFEYDNGEGDKSVSPPLVLWIQKNTVSIKILKTLSCFGTLYFSETFIRAV